MADGASSPVVEASRGEPSAGAEPAASAPGPAERQRRVLARFDEGIVRGDGSMGFMLARAGVARTASFEALNLTDPSLVLSVHRQYVDEASVQLLQSNTFGANRIHLATFGRGHEHVVREINRRGVELAREAAGAKPVLVGGSIGPLTHRSDDASARAVPAAELVRAAYEEQIRALGEARVDLFVIETIHRRDEGMAALDLAKEIFPDIPVVFQVASDRRSETIFGDDLETLVREAVEHGADILGLNCFLDPAEMYALVLELREWTDRPLAAQPNVGRRGTLCEGVYEIERSIRTTIATFGVKLVEAGVRLIGGCCGITPVHIALLRDFLAGVTEERARAAREEHRRRFATTRNLVQWPAPEARAPRSRFEADMMSQDPARRPVLVEIDPPRLGKTPDRALEGAALLASRGVRYVTVGDNPGRVPRLDRKVFSRMLLDRAPGIEIILHLSCADHTLVSFATELESIDAITRNVLVISGDPPSGEYAMSSAPYDLRSISGIRGVSRRNSGASLAWGESLPEKQYVVGGAFNPRGLAAQLRKLWTKAADAGAVFALTQPIFDRETLERTRDGFMLLRERLRRERGQDLFLFPGVTTITTLRNAQLLRDSFGMPVPKELLAHLETLPPDGQKALGVEVCRDVLARTRAELAAFAGVYVVTQFHDYERVAGLLHETGWLAGAPA